MLVITRMTSGAAADTPSKQPLLLLTGPMIVACHWKRLSPIGPAEHEDGGSRPRSMSSCGRCQ